MKRNLVPLLGIAFIVAIASTGIFYGLFVGKLKSSATAPAHNLVVAAKAVKSGTVLAATDLKTIPWAAETMPRGTYSEPEKVVGSTTVGAIAEGEPVMQERLASKDGGASDGSGVPSGLRAVSVHVSDSSGVLAILRPGNKVDVQVVTPKAVDPEARTIIQDLAVLSVSTAIEPAAQTGVTAPVVTLLARPAEADLLALADAAARVRLILRNSLDQEKQPRTTHVGLGSLLHGSGAGSTGGGAPSGSRLARPAVVGSTAPAGVEPEVALSVRFAGATQIALEELGRQLVYPGAAGEFQVSAFRTGTQPEAVLRKLQDSRQVDMITSSRLMASLTRAVSVEAGSLRSKNNEAACGLRVRFAPFRASNGKLKIRVQPEVVSPMGDASGFRKSETEVDVQDGQWFLVSGLTGSRESVLLSEKLFPLQPKSSGREFLVMVSPQLTLPGQN